MRLHTIKQRREKRFLGKVAMAGIVGVVLFFLASTNGQNKDEEKEYNINDGINRRQLSGGSCGDYEVDFWAVPLLALGILWVFGGLAVVCDDFFQPSLEAISEVCIFVPYIVFIF